MRAAAALLVVATQVLVTPTGRVGPLTVDVSTRAQVLAFAGRPDLVRRGREPGGRPYIALGYACRTDDPFSCATAFYVDARTDLLTLIDTREARYVEPHGVRAGTPLTTAQQLLGVRAFEGCYTGFRFDTRRALLVLWMEPDIPGSLGSDDIGEHVDFLVVEGKRFAPGVLDCIDS